MLGEIVRSEVLVGEEAGADELRRLRGRSGAGVFGLVFAGMR